MSEILGWMLAILIAALFLQGEPSLLEVGREWAIKAMDGEQCAAELSQPQVDEEGEK